MPNNSNDPILITLTDLITSLQNYLDDKKIIFETRIARVTRILEDCFNFLDFQINGNTDILLDFFHLTKTLDKFEPIFSKFQLPMSKSASEERLITSFQTAKRNLGLKYLQACMVLMELGYQPQIRCLSSVLSIIPEWLRIQGEDVFSFRLSTKPPSPTETGSEVTVRKAFSILISRANDLLTKFNNSNQEFDNEKIATLNEFQLITAIKFFRSTLCRTDNILAILMFEEKFYLSLTTRVLSYLTLQSMIDNTELHR